jgi:hypothetical protein
MLERTPEQGSCVPARLVDAMRSVPRSGGSIPHPGGGLRAYRDRRGQTLSESSQIADCLLTPPPDLWYYEIVHTSTVLIRSRPRLENQYIAWVGFVFATHRRYSGCDAWHADHLCWEESR